MTHRDDEIAAFILGALDEEESPALRAHLEECSTCRAEYGRLKVAAEALPLAVEQYRAPAAIGQRLMATVREEAQPDTRRLPRWFGATPALAFPALAFALALVVGVLAVAGVFSGGGSGSRAILGQVIGARAASDVLRVHDGRGELVIARMVPPPAGRIYEVWLERAGGALHPTDALFGVTRQGGAVVAVPGGLNGVHRVLVTAEPLGGSARPTRAPVIVVSAS